MKKRGKERACLDGGSWLVGWGKREIWKSHILSFHFLLYSVPGKDGKRKEIKNCGIIQGSKAFLSLMRKAEGEAFF